MLPAINFQAPTLLSLNPFKTPQKNYTIQYQEDRDTLVIKGAFDTQKSMEALQECHQIIKEHLEKRRDIHLFLYFKTYDLANIHTWTQTMDDLEQNSDRILVNWFMNGTNNQSYQIANEVLHSYRVRTIDVI